MRVINPISALAKPIHEATDGRRILHYGCHQCCQSAVVWCDLSVTLAGSPHPLTAEQKSVHVPSDNRRPGHEPREASSLSLEH